MADSANNPWLGMLADPKVGGMIEGYLAGLQPSSTPVTWGGLLGGALRGSREAQEREAAKAMRDKEFGLKERGFDIQQQLADIKRQGLLQRMQGGADSDYGLLKGLSGPAREAASLEVLRRKLGEDNPAYQAALKDHEQRYEGKKSLQDYRERSLSAKTFSSQPADVKSQIVAKAEAIGIDPIEIVRQINAGHTPEEIFAELGYDYNEVVPQYAPSKKNVSDLNQRGGIISEIDFLESQVHGQLGDYTRTINGLSPAFLADQIKGENPDKQALAIAWWAYQPELAVLRIRAQGGSVAQETVKDMVKKAQGDSKVISGLVSPDVYEKSQRIMNQWNKGMFDASKKSILGAKGKKQPPKTFNPADLANMAKKKGRSEAEIHDFLVSQGFQPEGFE